MSTVSDHWPMENKLYWEAWKKLVHMYPHKIVSRSAFGTAPNEECIHIDVLKKPETGSVIVHIKYKEFKYSEPLRVFPSPLTVTALRLMVEQ